MLTHPQFDPIAFSIGPLSVHWYGLMYLLGFAVAWALASFHIKKGLSPISTKQMEDTIFYVVLGVVLGGRLGYVLFYQPSYYFSHPSHIFAIWDGGMSFHGGLLGVLTVILLQAWRYGLTFFQLADFVAPLVPPALAFGRWGNFINGELWGRPTNGQWGMIFPSAGDSLPRHPSQLYELTLEGVVLFLILWCFSSKPRPTGQISALFLIFYGLFRFLVEYTREPDRYLGTLALGLSMGQWLSVPMIVFGILLFVISARKQTPAR
ncbi:prolipoprotein diacylglyceryl transferase [Brackiella oedipodis]|uniref:prolipoprotein diacylglyceryl transferase n=1 Tax=Brackiella oedipodis TaxID=124225 RepID=UPI00048AAE32|nr:prolipoprotein diacylglyceryl transferase [Brackiella oedipodis]